MSSSDEYQAIRAEILHEYQRQVNLSSFVFAATAAIIGYGFTAQPVVFLVPLLLLAFLLFQLANSCRAILNISVYIRVWFEERTEYREQRWETTVSLLRKELRSKKRYYALTEVIYARLTAAIGAICILLSIIYTFRSAPAWYEYLAPAIAVVVWAIICILGISDLNYANNGDYEKEVTKDLISISKELNKGLPQVSTGDTSQPPEGQ